MNPRHHPLLMRALALVVPVVLAGCATMNVNGFELDEDRWRTSDRDIRKRAALELSCPDSMMDLTVLAASPSTPSMAMQVAVSGCGRRVIYVYAGGNGYVANSVSNTGSN